jgi:hypothetical protein
MSDRSGSDENDGSYKTGYKNPPLEHRFKKGHAGRPRGKAAVRSGKEGPRKDFLEHVLDELDGMVPVIENGKPGKMPGITASAKNMAKDIIKGDAKARGQFLQAIKQARAQSPSTALLAPEKPRRTIEEIMFDFTTDMQEATYERMCEITDKMVDSRDDDRKVLKAIVDDYEINKRKYNNDFSYKMMVIMLIAAEKFKSELPERLLLNRKQRQR